VHPRRRVAISPVDRAVVVEGTRRGEGVAERATSRNEAAVEAIGRADGVRYSVVNAIAVLPGDRRAVPDRQVRRVERQVHHAHLCRGWYARVASPAPSVRR